MMTIKKILCLYGAFSTMSCYCMEKTPEFDFNTERNNILMQEQSTFDPSVQHFLKEINVNISPETSCNDALQSINDALPTDSTVNKLLQELTQQSPLFKQKINDYILQNESEQNLTLTSVFNNHITAQKIKLFATTISVDYLKTLQKSTAAFLSNKKIAMIHIQFQEGACYMWGNDQPYTTEYSSVFHLTKNSTQSKEPKLYTYSIKHYTIVDPAPYTNQPDYRQYNEKKNIDNYESGLQWFKSPLIEQKITAFPDATRIVTMPWGGITIKKKNEKKQRFVINNSISSVACLSDNKTVVLGSYDGTITLIDITQKDTDPDHRPQKQYFLKKVEYDYTPRENIPSVYTVATHCIQGGPISHIIACDENTFLIANDNSLYTVTRDNKNLKTELLANEAAVGLTSIDEKIIYTDQKTVSIRENNTTKEYDLYQNDNESITSIGSYKNDTDYFIVTGTDHGSLDIWRISSSTSLHNNQDPFLIAHINHDHPIISIEMSPKKEKILIKTRESIDLQHDNKKYIDHFFIYDVPEYIASLVKEYKTKCTSIQTLYERHQKTQNACVLYKIFTQNMNFLDSKYTTLALALKENLIAAITTIIQKTPVHSLTDLKNMLLLFDDMRIGNPMKAKFAADPRSIPTDPLDRINSPIIQAQKTIFAQTVQQLFQHNTFTKRELNEFATHFSVTIDWEKLLNRQTTDIGSCITSANFTLFM